MYIPASIGLNKKLLLLFSLLFVGWALVFNLRLTFATHDCDDIQDLDDKAACLEEEIEEKEEEYESVSKKLSDIRKQKDEVNAQINELSSQLSITQEQLDSISSQISALQDELKLIEENLVDRNTKLDKKIAVRNLVLRNYSKRGVLNNLELFFGNNFALSGANQMFNQKVTSETLKIIKILNTEITNF